MFVGGMAQRSMGRRDNSSTETCGYVTFLLSHVIILAYLLWIMAPEWTSRRLLPIDEIDDASIRYAIPSESAAHVQSFLILLFALTPMLYMGANMLSCPNVDVTLPAPMASRLDISVPVGTGFRREGTNANSATRDR
ncbi:hypothetical protein ACHAXA_003318 [Cyclostephanos tholiformis]|uniref:Uncharacterized protein n=1 Tax=Cyclostephanos tholiformis TaxID=382380 RepID=A0ABD3SBN0_9STRA